MDPVDVNCPVCETRLEVPAHRERVRCPRCGTSYDASRLREKSRFAEAQDSVAAMGDSPLAIVDSSLAELDQLIAEAREEIEALRSRELSAPLHLGCSFFGLFLAVTVVLSVFMFLGKGYFGGWTFYFCLVAVVAAGIARIRRKLKDRISPSDLRNDRLRLERGLGRLLTERDRVRDLKSDLGVEG